MNTIRKIQELNKAELAAGVKPEGSWHTDYRDTAYIYIGGLPFDLSEGDIITIFSQFGEPVFINLVRDKETGKSKGFCFLKYEDQRSCDLAVDNLGGAVIMGRTLRVDHTRYKKKDDEPEVDNTMGSSAPMEVDESENEIEYRPMLKEERELAELIRDHDEEDPMKAYMIEQKKEEVQKALKRYHKDKQRPKKNSDRHHSRRHRSRSRSNERTYRRHTHRSKSPREDKTHHDRRSTPRDWSESPPRNTHRYHRRPVSRERSPGRGRERSDSGSRREYRHRSRSTEGRYRKR
jgi:RNA-binding motif protein, X-linked 2